MSRETMLGSLVGIIYIAAVIITIDILLNGLYGVYLR